MWWFLLFYFFVHLVTILQIFCKFYYAVHILVHVLTSYYDLTIIENNNHVM